MEAQPSTTRRILRLSASLEAELAAVLARHELTVDRWRVLDAIVRAPATSMSELSDDLCLAPASATRAVDGLVDRGLVVRSGDPTDRRRTVLRPTPTGRATLRRVGGAVLDAEERVATRLGERWVTGPDAPAPLVEPPT